MLTHRPEIDGLRAVAVLPVLLCHAKLQLFSGGFVGVDVFFVISGYLITRLLLDDMAADRFSLLAFYERRARRILPMLFLVVGISLAAGWLLLLPYQLEKLSWSALSLSAFASNVYFWRSLEYFSEVADLNPLLHTWSLAVEEQFYILFPVALVVLMKAGRRAAVSAFCLVSLLSLAAGQAGGNLKIHPPYVEETLDFFAQPSWASFYLPTGRLHELLVGGLVAMCRRAPEPGALAQTASLAGLTLIAVAIVAFDDGLPYPGVYTLVPVTGAALVIRYAVPGTLAAGLLAARAPVAVGLISYSLYLWHQPLFAFARVVSETPPTAPLYLALIAVAVGLSFLTWRYVELPFRRRGTVSRRGVFAAAAAATAAVVAASAAGIASGGGQGRFPAMDRDMVSRSPEAWGDYVTARFDALAGPFPASGRPRLLIVGDSYAQDFVNMAAENGRLAGYDIRTFYIPEKCQIYLGDEDVSGHVPAAYRMFCRNSPTLAAAADRIAAADVVILAARWVDWAAVRLPETLRRLNLHADQKLVVIGSKFYGRLNLNQATRLTLAERLAMRRDQDLPVNRTLAAGLPEGRFVDAQEMVCGRPARCPLFTPDGRLISFDGGHVTAAGAAFVGGILFRHPALAGLE